MIKQRIRRHFRYIRNPESAFMESRKQSFEEQAGDYMILLLLVGVTSGLVTFVFSFFKSVYLDLFTTIGINYWRMSNYAFGKGLSLFFLFLFAGTFGVFFLSILLRPFFHRMKYTRLFALIFASLSPLLLFGWVPVPPYGFFIWAIVLFIIGARSIGKESKIEKTSLKQRD
ncbi:MAG: hypothetical protein ABIJ21_00770 [Nanoarchaeota archaeon]